MEGNKPISNKEFSGDSYGGDSYGGDSTSRATKLKPTRDRLSDLPDLALTHILSHLFVEEAARTTVLSKRFNSLWNSVSILKLSDKHSGKGGVLFISFVDIVLKLHRCREIEKFSVKFRYDFMFASSVNDWIEFAVKKKVKSLCLNLTQKVGNNRHRIPTFEHKLPEFLYNNQILVELITRACKFSTEGLINWSSLKLLSVSETKLNEELISRVLGGCPVLETLELRIWSGFDKLKIDSVSLRVLRVIDEKPPNYVVLPEDNCFLEISGPNLVSLEVSGSLYRSKLLLKDAGCLSNAVMNFEIKPRKWSNETSRVAVSVRDQHIVREVLESLCFVRALTVGRCCIEAVSAYEAYNLSSPLSERRSLTLCLNMIKGDHLGIASLLHSSPDLETLAIRLSNCSDKSVFRHSCCNTNDEDYYWKSWSTISKCPLKHLKTVKVIGFCHSCVSMKPLFQFLEFLLRNSSVLLEIVLQTSKNVTQGLVDEALKLLDVPTASPDVVVRYEPPHLWVDPLSVYQKSVHV